MIENKNTKFIFINFCISFKYAICFVKFNLETNIKLVTFDTSEQPVGGSIPSETFQELYISVALIFLFSRQKKGEGLCDMAGTMAM